MRNSILLPVLIAATLTGGAFAQTLTEDVLNLAKKNASEEVMLAFVEASNSAIELSSDDILRLKEANVPEKVIVAMLRHHPAINRGSAPEPVVNRPAPRVVNNTPPVPAEEILEEVKYQDGFPGANDSERGDIIIKDGSLIMKSDDKDKGEIFRIRLLDISNCKTLFVRERQPYHIATSAYFLVTAAINGRVIVVRFECKRHNDDAITYPQIIGARVENARRQANDYNRPADNPVYTK